MPPSIRARALIQVEGMGMARIAEALQDKIHLSVSGRFLAAKAFPPGALDAIREVLARPA
jgi:hypothetical protein